MVHVNRAPLTIYSMQIQLLDEHGGDLTDVEASSKLQYTDFISVVTTMPRHKSSSTPFPSVYQQIDL